jgi:pimeloyl-ACP methyl ester carboxylesterase
MRVVRRLLALGLVIAAVVTGAALARREAVRPVLTGAHRCDGAPGFTCSLLAVPLDHRGRAGGTLKFAVAVQDGDASRGTLLFLTGGPGQPGVPFVARIAQRLAALTEGYRVVMFDQRGTGGTALVCPALQRQMGISDLAVPTTAAVVACARAIGPKRQFFGTDQTVEDIEALRVALEADKLVLDGVSYGTFVAERYALAHPGRVAKLVLDSVVPHDGAGALGVENAHAVGRVIGARAAADLDAVVRMRPRVELPLFDAIVTTSIVDPTFGRVAPALRAARAGNWSPLDSFLADFRPDPSVPVSIFSQGLHASALCADTPLPWGGPAAPLARRAPALRRAVARIRDSAVWPFTRRIASGNGIVATCLAWPPEPAPRRLTAKRLPNVPTLLVNGDRDLSTPLVWARAEAKVAPGGRLVVAAGAGHSVQLRAVDDAPRRAIAEFLR